MAFRIVTIILVLIASYLSFQIYTLSSLSRAAFKVPAEYTSGSDSADLKVVEFLDYSCPDCRQIHPIIKEALQKDGRVTYIPRPLPSSDAQSVKTAQLVYAAGKQGRFIDVHNALIENFQNGSGAIKSHIPPDIDRAKLEEDAKDEAILKTIARNGEVYMKLGRDSVPTFLIGKKIIYVPEDKIPTVEDFLRMFNEARGL